MCPPDCLLRRRSVVSLPTPNVFLTPCRQVPWTPPRSCGAWRGSICSTRSCTSTSPSSRVTRCAFALHAWTQMVQTTALGAGAARQTLPRLGVRCALVVACLDTKQFRGKEKNSFRGSSCSAPLWRRAWCVSCEAGFEIRQLRALHPDDAAPAVVSLVAERMESPFAALFASATLQP